MMYLLCNSNLRLFNTVANLIFFIVVRGSYIHSAFSTRACPFIPWHNPGTTQGIKGQALVDVTLTVKLSLVKETILVSPPFLYCLFLLFLLDTPRPLAEDSFIRPDEYAVPEVEGPGRAKRSPIITNRVGGLNVETLVVADRKMVEKHSRENITTYVLTVMNMVRVRTMRKRGKEEVQQNYEEVIILRNHIAPFLQTLVCLFNMKESQHITTPATQVQSSGRRDVMFKRKYSTLLLLQMSL